MFVGCFLFVALFRFNFISFAVGECNQCCHSIWIYARRKKGREKKIYRYTRTQSVRMFMRAKIENRLTKSVSVDEKHEFEVHLTWTNAIHIFFSHSFLFFFFAVNFGSPARYHSRACENHCARLMMFFFRNVVRFNDIVVITFGVDTTFRANKSSDRAKEQCSQ